MFHAVKGITVQFTTSSIQVLEDEGPAEVCAIITSGGIAGDFDKTLRAATQTLEASEALRPNMKATGKLCEFSVLGSCCNNVQ